MNRSIHRFFHTALALSTILFGMQPGEAVVAQSANEDVGALSISVDDAIEIALLRSYDLRKSRLDLEEADWLVREGFSQAYPQLSVSSNYQRNLQSPNPFSGSDAGGFFSTLSFLDWLSFNEQARTDNDPSTSPLTLGEFRERQNAGLEEAGLATSSSDNPFQVDNQFDSFVTLEQTLFDGAVYGGIEAAKMFREIREARTARQIQLLISNVKTSYYNAVLAQEQAEVVRKSVSRTAKTVEETEKRVAQGVAPKYDRLSAEVELANLQTDLVNAENQLSASLDNLKMILGIPIEQPVLLRDDLSEGLEEAEFRQVSLEDLLSHAQAQRPDLEAAALQIEVNRIRKGVERAAGLPRLSAFVNFGYIGNVPDDRSSVTNVEGDPFQFASESNGFFSSSYWNKSSAIGLRLSWTIFSGFQTRSRMEQMVVARRQAEVDLEQLQNQVRREIAAARRDLFAAERRMTSQSQNVERAALNYDYALTRLREGVSSRLEERQASTLLDQSRLNFNRAVYDYLQAQAAFEAAVGASVTGETSGAGITGLIDN